MHGQNHIKLEIKLTAISFQVVPLLGRLVAVLSLQIVVFDPKPIHVGILLDNVAPKRGFVRTLRFPPSHRSTNALYSLIYHRRCMKLAIDSAIS